MNNAGIHFILILSLVALAIVIVKTARRRQSHNQYIYRQANRIADAAEHVGSYDDLIEIERQRRKNRIQSNPNE